MPSASLRASAAVADLVRWPNALIAAAGVFAGAWFAAGDATAPATAWLALAAVALTAVANAADDLADREIDAVAHPRRPLPSGRLTTGTARAVVAVAGLVAIAATVAGVPALLRATIVVIVLMLLYGAHIKPLGLPGNLAVALLASVPFLYGAASVGQGERAAPLVMLAVPLHFAREVAKDLDDAGADAGWRRTLPVAYGPRAARVALAVAMALFALALAGFSVSRPRFAVAALPMLALCGVATRRAWGGEPGAPRLYKLAMVLALLALAAAR